MSLFGSIFGYGCRHESQEDRRVREMHELHQENVKKIIQQLADSGQSLKGFVYSGDAAGGYQVKTDHDKESK